MEQSLGGEDVSRYTEVWKQPPFPLQSRTKLCGGHVSHVVAEKAGRGGGADGGDEEE